MKKLMLTICLLLAAAMIFAGGNRQSGSGTTLTVWDFKYGEEGTGRVFRELDRMFMDKHPGVTINHVAQPETEYYSLLSSAFRARTAVDVVMIHPESRAWQLADFFEVLDTHITAERGNYSAATLKAMSPPNDSRVRMLPLTNQGMGIYFNKTNFQRAGLDPNKIPSSWNDFLASCEALKNAGIPPVVFGTPHGVCFMYRTILATLYGSRLEGFRNGTANFTDPEFRQATAAIKELFDKGYVNVEAGSISYFTDAIEVFKSGRGGFFVGLLSDIAHWKDFATGLGQNNVGYFPSPILSGAANPNAQINQGAGIGFSVVNYSRNKDLAIEYIKHYTSGQGARLFMESVGAIVPNSSIPVERTGILGIILDHMHKNPAPDFMQCLPGAMENDFYALQFLFFISKEITIDEYITRAQALYKSVL